MVCLRLNPSKFTTGNYTISPYFQVDQLALLQIICSFLQC